MTTAGATSQLNGRSVSRSSGRRKTAGISRNELKKRTRGLLLIIAVAGICLLLVFMAAFAANLRRENTQLQKDNEYLQA